MEIADRGPARQIDGLTSLRFFAAIAVVMFHNMYFHDFPVLEQIWQATRHGSVGVGIFFLLSGFILAHVYGRGLEEGRFSRRDFFAARFARVYPIYLVGLALAFPGFALKILPSVREEGLLSTELWALFTAPVLLQAWQPDVACAWNCPGWSLSAEAFFYALFPLIGLAAVRMSQRRLWLALVALYALMTSLSAAFYFSPLPTQAEIDPNPWIAAFWYTPVMRLPEFVFGVLLARATMGQSWEFPRWVPTAGLIAVALCFYAAYFLPRRFVDTFFQNGGLAPLYALIFVAIAKARPGSRTWLENPALVRLGEASYALYIIHTPVFGIMRFIANAGLLPAYDTFSFYVLYSSIVIAASLALYRWVEVPCRAYLRRPRASSAKSTRRSPAFAG